MHEPKMPRFFTPGLCHVHPCSKIINYPDKTLPFRITFIAGSYIVL